MSKVQVGQVVKVRLSDHMGSLGQWTHAVVVELGTQHPMYGQQVRCLLDPAGPMEPGNKPEVTRYTGASRFELCSSNPGMGVMPRLAQAYASLTIQSKAGDTRMTQKYQAPEIQTVNLRVTRNGAFSKLDGQKLAAVLEHPDVLQAVKESFDGASTQTLEDTQRMLNGCANELEAEREKNAELYRKLVALTSRHDAVVVQLNSSAARCTQLESKVRRQTQPATESEYLQELGQKRGFILWCPTSSKPPSVVYQNLEKAKYVQETMAKLYPNQLFHILPIGPGLKIVKPVAAQRVEV